MRSDHRQLAATYRAAADHFDDLPFWSHFGRATVARLGLQPGARVLDLCCGTGASALPAAAAAGLHQVSFDATAVESLRFSDAAFDAIVSVFGLFFVDDMAGLLSRAWSWLAPGGVLAITSWGEQVLAPGEALFWEAVLRED